MEKFCKRLRIIGLLINGAAGVLMGWFFDGTKLVIAMAILILGMLGMSFTTFATIKLEEICTEIEPTKIIEKGENL